MPRIKLKPNSPDYDDGIPEEEFQFCEMPGCVDKAGHKAPKHRGLNEYHYFCLEHVREYNKAWNFFSGMSQNEVHEHMMKSMYGDRPTWRYGVDGEDPAEALRKKIWQTYHYREDEPPKNTENARFDSDGRMKIYSNTPEFEALAIMGLQPPITLDGVRKRYKQLVKKHHPDLNHGCKKSEEILKRVNMAYTILKVAYEQFEKIEV